MGSKLCTGLKEGHLVFLSVLLTSLGSYRSLILSIKFIAEHYKWEAFWAGGPTIIHEALAPPVEVLHADGVSDVVNETAAVCTPVEGVS